MPNNLNDVNAAIDTMQVNSAIDQMPTERIEAQLTSSIAFANAVMNITSSVAGFNLTAEEIRLKATIDAMDEGEPLTENHEDVMLHPKVAELLESAEAAHMSPSDIAKALNDMAETEIAKHTTTQLQP